MTEDLDAEIAHWRAAGLHGRFFLRDDDATEPSPALERLLALVARFHAPLLLAVIPEPATPALAARLEVEPLIHPCQHGFAHRNHAAAGEKACEIGGARPIERVLDEILRGHGKLVRLFGDRLRQIFVPPWNRIDAAVAPHLPGLGFGVLSTFGPPRFSGINGLVEINCDLDIIDWKRGRVGIAHDRLCSKLVDALRMARGAQGAPVGILTHHLAHDETAWGFLERFCAWASMLDGWRFASIEELAAD